MTGLVVHQPLFKPRCPYCRTVVDTAAVVAGPQACSHCGKDYQATAFALAPPPAERAPLGLAEVPGATTPCAYHPGNAALAHCGRCGVVMCDLCRIDLVDRQLCAPCFDRLAESKELRLHQNRAPDFRGLAWLSVLGSFTFYCAPILGPAAIVFGILGLRERRRAGGDGPGVVSSVLAIGCGAVVLVGGLFFVGLLATAIVAGKPQ